MIVYRLSDTKYADAIDGYGAKLFGGRWNSVGLPMLYTTQYISLAVLEILVKTTIANSPSDHSLASLSIADKVAMSTLEKAKLKSNWKMDINYSRFIGDSFLKDGNAAILQVPSAIIDTEHNYLFNPLHPDFKILKIISIAAFQFDKRLFLKNE